MYSSQSHNRGIKNSHGLEVKFRSLCLMKKDSRQGYAQRVIKACDVYKEIAKSQLDKEELVS